MAKDDVINRTPDGLADIIRQGVLNYMKDVHTALPAKIVEFDAVEQKAKVQLLIKRIFKGEEQDKELEIPPLINVPVWFPKVQGFSITMPIQPEDECVVIFSERSIDKWFKFGGSQPPNDFRLHSLSDGMCFVGISSIPNVVENYNTDNFQIRNAEGDTIIDISPDKVITLDANGVSITINQDGNITMEASTQVTVNTPLAEFSDNVLINGDLEVVGSTTLSSTVTSNGTDISDTHSHSGSPTAPNGPVTNTGNPV